MVEDSEGAAHYILSGTWDEKMESSKIVDSSQGCGGSEGKQKTVYQTLQPKLLWKKYPLPYVSLIISCGITASFLDNLSSSATLSFVLTFYSILLCPLSSTRQ